MRRHQRLAHVVCSFRDATKRVPPRRKHATLTAGHTIRKVVSLLALLCFPTALAAMEKLPDGGTARHNGRGVVEAWYAQPTTRYQHGVLGDAVEGGSLIAVDHLGQQFEFVLPTSQVFEDITPFVVDLDGDGVNEVVTIRSGVSDGASVVVYAVVDGDLIERAATAPIGQPHRWLSIAGIADFRGDGTRQIAIVKTPHVGGVLELLALMGDELVSLYSPRPGYSTHVIGSRILSLAGIGDLDGNETVELALPDQSRRRLVVLRFAAAIEEVFSQDLPSRIDAAIHIMPEGQKSLPLEAGRPMLIDARQCRQLSS